MQQYGNAWCSGPQGFDKKLQVNALYDQTGTSANYGKCDFAKELGTYAWYVGRKDLPRVQALVPVSFYSLKC